MRTSFFLLGASALVPLVALGLANDAGTVAAWNYDRAFGDNECTDPMTADVCKGCIANCNTIVMVGDTQAWNKCLPNCETPCQGAQVGAACMFYCIEEGILPFAGSHAFVDLNDRNSTCPVGCCKPKLAKSGRV